MTLPCSKKKENITATITALCTMILLSSKKVKRCLNCKIKYIIKF